LSASVAIAVVISAIVQFVECDKRPMSF